MDRNDDRFRVGAGISAHDIKYLEIDGEGVSATIRVSDVGASRNGLEQALSTHQMIMTPSQRTQIIEQASAIVHYPLRPYSERAGWVDAHNYIRGNGEITTASGNPAATRITFTCERRGTGQRGSLPQWRRRIARRLNGQTLLQFVVMASFAGPVLPLTRRALNVLFEIVGTGGEGKSSALHIAASTCGPAVDRGNGTYWFGPSGTTNWLEARMLASADATAFLDEFQVFGAGENHTTRARMVYDFIFRFSEGQTRGRLDGSTSITYRGVGVMTANQPVRELMTARHGLAVNPTTSRLISQPGDVGFGLGTLDFLPAGELSARSFVESVLLATEDNHGTAMPAFLEGIVRLRSREGDELRNRINTHIDDFVTQAIGGAGGLHGRIAEAYAIVYVGGRLAKHFGILPTEWDPFAIALESYRRHAASIQVAECKSPGDVLKAYAARVDVIDLNQGLPVLDDAEMAKVSGFRRAGPNGRELYVPPHAITRLFPDWESQKNTPEIAQFLKREGAHLGRKRAVRQGGGKIRLHVFAGFD
ncbi:DUF927 domain-containing protein [Sphingomonas sp. Tas61C01]|uniref:DUF927 domain-containing protein n=1 Tax=Sphingomonas sp. Tas61C01 TaxID=3458297 RepID=UPI00403E907E